MTDARKRTRVEFALSQASLVLESAQVDALCDALESMDQLRALLRAGERTRHRYVEPAHTFRLTDTGSEQ
jgi:hypothetical protein